MFQLKKDFSFSLFCHRLFNCSEWRFHFSLLIQNFGKSWFFKSPAKNQRKKKFWKKNFLEKKFFRPEKFFFQKIFFPVDFSLWFFAGSLKNQLFPNDFWQNVPIYSKIKKNTLLHYFDCFHTLLGKITKLFEQFFPVILVQKVILETSSTSRACGPRSGKMFLESLFEPR